MKKFRKNNKGFTMVELIIVIAIIAVLSAVAAPQYLKYVEKAKVSADEDLIARVYSAAQVVLVDEDYDVVDEDQIVISDDGIVITPKAAGSEIVAAMQEYFGVTFTAQTGGTYLYADEKLQSYTSATFVYDIPGSSETFAPKVTKTVA